MNTFTLTPDQELATKWWTALAELKRKYFAFKYYQKDDANVTVEEINAIWEKQILHPIKV